MTTSFAGVANATLAKLCDKIVTCVVRPDGTAPAAAPNAFKDRLGKQAVFSGSEVTITIKINKDGQTAFIKVLPADDPNSGQAIEGQCDVTVLGTVLA